MKMQKVERAQQLLASPEFKHLVAARWSFSLRMTFVMLIIYFGFILAVGFGKALLSVKIGAHLNIGLGVGLGVIVLAWAMTGIYVHWANTKHDARVKLLIDRLNAADSLSD